MESGGYRGTNEAKFLRWFIINLLILDAEVENVNQVWQWIILCRMLALAMEVRLSDEKLTS